VVGYIQFLVARQIEEFRQTVLGCVSQCFRVDQTLALVLQFDVGPHCVNTQSDASLLQLASLFVEPLCKCDTRAGGIARRHGPKNHQVLVHDRVDYDLARGLIVRASLARTLATDLVLANLREVDDGLRKSRTGFDNLEGACSFPGMIHRGDLGMLGHG
jgi:hypothetical protein